MKLNKSQRAALFKKNAQIYYALQKQALSKDAYQKLLEDSHEYVKNLLDADLMNHSHPYNVDDLKNSNVEKLKLICLDKNKNILSESIIAVGNDHTVPLDFKVIGEILSQDNKTQYFTLIHNHTLAYGAKFSSMDYKMAFVSARFGELLEIYLSDFIAVTDYDAVSLSQLEMRGESEKIINFDLSDSQFSEQSVALTNANLHAYLIILKNKRHQIIQTPTTSYRPTSHKDVEYMQELISRLIAHCEDEKMREEIIGALQDIIQRWS